MTSPSVPSSTCILIPTVARYQRAAELTLRLIDDYWPNHPKIFVCGLASQEPMAMPLRDPPEDWMAIVRSAVVDLRLNGCERAYLILDDQGPMAPCHPDHLNHTIPRWMTELDAAYISIRGWDHRRNSSGKNLGRRFLYLQRQSPRFPWRFALHPALWRLSVLEGVFEMLMGPSGRRQRTPWAFEREAGRLGAALPPAWNEGTYRVCGRAMSLNPAPTSLLAFRHVRDGLARNLAFVVNTKICKPLSWNRLPVLMGRVLRTDAVFYDGPYPMHYRGFLVRGQINLHLKRHLERRGQTKLLDAMLATLPQA